MTADRTPTKVDTRTRLADAVLHVIADRGLEHASVREVATAARMSIGAVQHHFPTKDDMLVAAFEQVIAATEARLAAVRLGEDVRRNLTAVLRQLLPLDATREAEVRVYLAFAARAATSNQLAQVQQDLQGRLLDGLTEALQRARSAGRGPAAGPPLNPRADAELLLAVADGLAFDVVSNPIGADPGRASRLLDRYLARLLP
ncbi:TetR/AcrR family transcriptional regulator [Luteipulveratus mongoliensis]|uniref:TetR/AcrR family transcriptional regulator n=1 Tax=Luteipulveratus mongoliensis TaxID=571913 RepID=UPI000695AC59|nr:TetR family transcriptional regulator C-terminal domain-containing protein [Luteipulveratus mongoliensis]